MRMNPHVVGTVFTEFQDLDWEMNGLVTYSRKRQEFGYDISKIVHNQIFLGIDAPPIIQMKPDESRSFNVFCSYFGSLTMNEGLLSWRLVGTNTRGESVQLSSKGTRKIILKKGTSKSIAELAVKLPEGYPITRLECRLENKQGDVVSGTFIDILSGSVDAASESRNDFSLFAGKLEGWSSSNPVMIEGECEALELFGSGTLEVSLKLPKEPSVLLFEATSNHPCSGQTEPAFNEELLRSAAPLNVYLNRELIACLPIAEVLADSRGVLSWAENYRYGRYGRLFKIPLPPSRYSEDVLRLHLDDKKGACHGLILFASRLGRYPVQPAIIDPSHLSG